MLIVNCYSVKRVGPYALTLECDGFDVALDDVPDTEQGWFEAHVMLGKMAPYAVYLEFWMTQIMDSPIWFPENRPAKYAEIKRKAAEFWELLEQARKNYKVMFNRSLLWFPA